MLLPSRFTRLEEDVNQIREDVNQIREDVNQIRKDTTQMSGQIANLTGNDYESKAIEQSRRMIRRHLGMQSATLVYASRQDSSRFEEDVLVPAINDGRIDRQQADQLEEADSIIRCQDQQGNIVCAVVEISVTVQDHDRSRAAERARVLQTRDWRTHDALCSRTGTRRSQTRDIRRAFPRVPTITSRLAGIYDNQPYLP